MRGLAPNAYADDASPSLAPAAVDPIEVDVARIRMDQFLIRHAELQATVVWYGIDQGSPEGDRTVITPVGCAGKA